MRVAMDARSLTSPVLRGMDRYLIGLAGELARRGVEVTFVHRQREVLSAPHLDIPGIKVIGLHDAGGIFWEQIALPRALERFKFDLYHAPAERGVPFVAPCPVVLTYHSTTRKSYSDLIDRGLLSGSITDYLDDGPTARGRVFEQYGWWQQYRADQVLTPSQFSRQELIRLNRLAPQRVTATPLAVADQFRRPRKSPEELRSAIETLGVRAPYLLYVGGYEKHKNVEGLVAMFHRIQQRLPEFQLVCVGSKPAPESIRARVRQLNLRAQQVLLLDGLSAELTDLYDAAELFVTLSWRETFCLPALEAMTRGTAVLASHWGASPEVVGDAGLLVDPRDPCSAATALLDFLAASDRETRAARALKQAAKFSWESTADLTIGVYEDVIRTHRT
jgi:glycosyltransferase involved in cell wall biosynthesis